MVDSDLLFEKSIIIYNETNEYIIHKDKTFLSFNKSSHSVKKIDYDPKGNPGYPVHSIIGLIEGKQYSYLIGVTKAAFLGNLLNAKLMQINDICFISSVGHSSSNIIHNEDKKYINMIKDFIQRNSLFYSEEADLTINISLTFSTKTPKKNSFIFKYTNPNYCWNYNLASLLDVSGLETVVHPIINGYVGVKTINCYSDPFEYIVIGRKDSRRSGMRFLVRGSDNNGSIANFIETEEIVVHKSNENKINLMSYVQLRGSIPLMWTQSPNLQLNPLIMPREDYSLSAFVFKKHVNELINAYGRTVLLNLIDKKNDQKNIGEFYQSLFKEFKENKSKII